MFEREAKDLKPFREFFSLQVKHCWGTQTLQQFSSAGAHSMQVHHERQL